MEKILNVKGLKKDFFLGYKKKMHAVKSATFDIYEGETLGVVGESGCGKTTLGRTIIGIYPKTAGEIRFMGKDTYNLNKKETKQLKKQAQMIFQDPYSSLNPKMKVKDIILEGAKVHNIVTTSQEREQLSQELLLTVGLNEEHGNRYAYEFSGGQRQRIGIARALAVDPKFIICDEPVSALDVSIQAQIINLLIDLQKKKNLTYLFIAHDLSVIKHISDRIAVMYCGKIVEIAKCEDLYHNPQHPYTKILLDSIPIADPKLMLEKNMDEIEARYDALRQIVNEEDSELVEVAPKHFVAADIL